MNSLKCKFIRQSYERFKARYSLNCSLIISFLFFLADSNEHKEFPVTKKCADDVSDDERSSSGVFSDAGMFGTSPPQSVSTMNPDPAAKLFEKSIPLSENKNLMKVHKSTPFAHVALRLYKDDPDIRDKWKKMIDHYTGVLQCTDYDRIKLEFGKCIDALLNDPRKIMLGLESSDRVVKHVLLTCMQMCIDPDYKLEIRVGLGGTEEPLTARVPAYVIAGILLLYRLFELSKYFLSKSASTGRVKNRHTFFFYLASNFLFSDAEKIPTMVLRNPPLLIFYSAHTAAVEANGFDPDIARQTAGDILSFIQAYINKFHSNLAKYVRYGIDHADTYEPTLLNGIIIGFKTHPHADKLIETLTKHAGNHDHTSEDSTADKDVDEITKEKSIKYAATHAIGFRDVIDQRRSDPLFHSFVQNGVDIQSYGEISDPDCIVSIGGSVERDFGGVREIIREVIRGYSPSRDEHCYYSPLSIRMLSEAGKRPVYYHVPKGEITVTDILKDDKNDLYRDEKMNSYVKEDLLIITDDIGIVVMKPMLEHIIGNIPSDISSKEEFVSSLTDSCWIYLKEYARDTNQVCPCSTDTREVTNQFLIHHRMPDDSKCTNSIIFCIMDCLQRQEKKRKDKRDKKEKKSQKTNGQQQNLPITTADSASSNNATTNDACICITSPSVVRETKLHINTRIDSILGSIFIDFIKEYNIKQKNISDLSNETFF